MTRGSDGQDDVDARFAEMVADLERDGFGDDFGAATGKPSSDFGPNAQDHRVDEPGNTGSTGNPDVWRGSTTEWDPDAGDDEHYVPPEPPPLPRLRPGTLIALTLLLFGAVLLIVPSLIGIPSRIGTPLSLVCMAFGLGLLILGMRSGPPDDTDDGAQV